MKFLGTFRRLKKLSQAELAEKVGISVNSLARYERGEVTPSVTIAHAIAEVLEITEAELLHGPTEEKIRITLVWDRKDVEGEINMSGNGFSLFLGDDGTVGIKGAAKFTSREALKEAAAAILKELEQGYDFQIQRGLIKAEG